MTSRMDPLRLIIVDDHRLYTDALKMLFHEQKAPSYRVVATEEDGSEVMDTLHRQNADLLLLDLNLPGLDGLDLLPEVAASFPDLKIIIVTMYDNPKFIQETIKQGASGYVVKTNGFTELKKAISEVMNGNVYISEGLMMFPKEAHEETLNGGKFNDSYEIKNKLTKREKEILILISKAKSSKEIAEILFISDQTVSVHRKNIMRKLNVSNTASLIKFALDNNLIE